MAYKAAYEIKCSCGAEFSKNLYEYIFAEYDPELRDALLSGEHSLVTCPSCRESFYVENRFLYRDEKNKLWVWVCKKGEESQRDQLTEELIEKTTYISDHFLDDKQDYRKFLVFGREGLIELLLKEDQTLKKAEGRRLKINPALRLIMETNEDPGYLFLNGEKVKISLPLRLSNAHKDLLTGPEQTKRWLKYYSQGLNIHNPYSSFLNKRLKSKWNKIREMEHSNSLDDEFEDFAESWARYKIDVKRFKTQCPMKREFFDNLKKINISRKVRSINARLISGESA